MSKKKYFGFNYKLGRQAYGSNKNNLGAIFKGFAAVLIYFSSKNK